MGKLTLPLASAILVRHFEASFLNARASLDFKLSLFIDVIQSFSTRDTSNTNDTSGTRNTHNT